jgi:hypothetical protein
LSLAAPIPKLFLRFPQIPAKNPTPKKQHPTIHLTHPIHHTLSTKTPHPSAFFPKTPSKNATHHAKKITAAK